MNFMSKTIRYGSILAAIFGVVMIVRVSNLQAERAMPPPGDPPVMPPQKPYVHAVAATGILADAQDGCAMGSVLGRKDAERVQERRKMARIFRYHRDGSALSGRANYSRGIRPW